MPGSTDSYFQVRDNEDELPFLVNARSATLAPIVSPMVIVQAIRSPFRRSARSEYDDQALLAELKPEWPNRDRRRRSRSPGEHDICSAQSLQTVENDGPFLERWQVGLSPTRHSRNAYRPTIRNAGPPVLTKQTELVYGEIDRAEPRGHLVGQRIGDGRSFSRVAPLKGHVEAKILQHEWIAVQAKLVPLPLAQSLRAALRAFVVRQRGRRRSRGA